MPNRPSRPVAPRAIIVMGVSGSGKTTIGRKVAESLDAAFIEADDLHPIINVEAMRRGEPLNDQMRWPWLAAIAEAAAREPGPVVISCSALRRSYRDLLRARLPGVVFLYLHASPDLLRSRMHDRSGHFMPESLLDSQLQTFEPLTHEPHLAVDVSGTPEEVADEALKALAGQKKTSKLEGRKTA